MKESLKKRHRKSVNFPGKGLTKDSRKQLAREGLGPWYEGIADKGKQAEKLEWKRHIEWSLNEKD